MIQDDPAGVVYNAYRRFRRRRIKTGEMRHMIALSSVSEEQPTSIQSSSRKRVNPKLSKLSKGRRVKKD
jgi:hypothetical protein